MRENAGELSLQPPHPHSAVAVAVERCAGERVAHKHKHHPRPRVPLGKRPHARASQRPRPPLTPPYAATKAGPVSAARERRRAQSRAAAPVVR